MFVRRRNLPKCMSISRNVPLDQFDPAAIIKTRNGSNGESIYLICHSGGRSQKACEKLQQAGFANAVSVEGGTQAWDQAGLPVVRGKKTMSLERQVRIAAGSLVLTGVLLGFFVHPAFFGLSGFVVRRLGLCGSDRHLRDGHDARADAVEPGAAGTACRA